MRKFKAILNLFLTMFKIGLFTFGGGYAMIAVIEREIVEKKKWIGHEEFLDVVAIAESSPGPLAINSATYIGYKVAGFLGSLFSTLGVVLPSFAIIFVISLFFDRFMELAFVGYAFRGIQACVAFLIISAGIKMARHLKRKPLEMILLFATVSAMVALNLFARNFSSVIYILVGGVIGLAVYLVLYFKERAKNKKDKGEKE